jgi:hypothetical protein
MELQAKWAVNSIKVLPMDDGTLTRVLGMASGIFGPPDRKLHQSRASMFLIVETSPISVNAGLFWV